jgi:hypothetical protein
MRYFDDNYYICFKERSALFAYAVKQLKGRGGHDHPVISLFVLSFRSVMELNWIESVKNDNSVYMTNGEDSC